VIDTEDVRDAMA